jgi:Putative peptidoglycan binding domain
MKNRPLAFTLALACAVTVVSTPRAEAVSCTVAVNLAPGAVNPAVLCLEQRLVELGYSVGTPDTSYGAASQAAVKAFQTSRGMYPHGTVTSITARQLGLRGPLPSGPSVPRVTVIGDSTSAAMRWYDEANGSSEIYDVMGTSSDLVWSVESCRRLVIASCRGRTDTVTNIRMTPVSALPLMQGSLRGRLGQALVIMAGYDDWTITSAVDQIVNEARSQGVSRVFWLNYRIGPGTYAYKKYYVAHNAELERAKGRHPNLVVLDWNTYSWFEADGIHLTKAGGKALAEYLRAAVQDSDVDECLAANASTGVADPSTGEPTPPPAVDTGFSPVAPTRVLDTRTPGTPHVGAGRTVSIDLAGALPAGAQTAVVQLTAHSPCANGFLTAFACGVRPGTANVNYASGRTTTGTAFSLLSGSSLCVHSSAATDLSVDLVGAFTPEGTMFHPNPGGPERWVDTRGGAAVTTVVGPLAAGQQVAVPVAGLGSVPADAEAVWLNVAAVPQAAGGSVTLYPGPCSTAPTTTNVSVVAGRAASAAALVALGDGTVCATAVGASVQLVVDLTGWFGGSDGGGLAYRGLTPERMFDSRPSPTVSAGGRVQVPAEGATLFNVAAIGSGGVGFASAVPCGSTQVTALLNTAAGETVSNLGAVAPGDGGAVCVSPSVATHLAIDVTGRFVAPPV